MSWHILNISSKDYARSCEIPFVPCNGNILRMQQIHHWIYGAKWWDSYLYTLPIARLVSELGTLGNPRGILLILLRMCHTLWYTFTPLLLLQLSVQWPTYFTYRSALAFGVYHSTLNLFLMKCFSSGMSWFWP